MKRFSWLLVVLFACPILLSGCSSSGPEAKKVQIELTLDKEPLTDADVRLVPKDDPELTQMLSGRTASDGKLEFRSDSKRPIKPGRYVVLVRKLVREDGSTMVLDPDIAVRPSDHVAMGGSRDAVPPAYNDQSRALLIIELTAGDNTKTYDLDSKKK